MQTSLFSRAVKLVLTGSAALAVLAASAQVNWTGGAGTMNWSDGANWAFGTAPQTFDIVGFENTPAGSTNVVANVNNVVNQPFTVSAIRYMTLNTNGYHHTRIPDGITLKVEGFTTEAISLSYGGVAVNNQAQYRISGPGSLLVNNPSGEIDATLTGGDNDHYAILDMSGLAAFSADISQMRMGATTTSGQNRAMGRIILAATNEIHTAPGVSRPGILVGAMENGQTTVRGTQQLLLGQHNVIKTDGIAVGGQKSAANFQFQGGLANPYISLRGSSGSGPVQLVAIADQKAGVTEWARAGSSVSFSASMNLSGGVVDGLVTDLYVGRTSTNSTGTATGTLTFDQGSLTVDNLYAGYHETTLTAAANASGTINVNGNAVLNVNNDLTLSRKAGSASPTGNLIVSSNAMVNVKGSILNAGGNSTVNVSGLIDLQPAGDSTKGDLTAGTLTGYGVVTNANNVTVTGNVSPGAGAGVGELAVYGNVLLQTNAVLTYNPSSASDLLHVHGNLTLNSNVVNVVPVSQALSPGKYRLVEYTGTLTGYLLLNNQSRYTAELDYSTANQINLVITGGGAEALKWNGLASGAWDMVSSNWLNSANEPDKFQGYDAVRVDDSTAATNHLWLSGTLFPSTVTVESSTRDYTFTGSGRVSGGASLLKRGTSMLTVSNANDFTGPVTIEGGIFRMANATALGSTAGGTTVLPGGTLDVGGIGFNAGEWITISGTGLNNTGAVINTGAQQFNAIRYLTLAEDSLVSTGGRWDVRGPSGAGSFSGNLDLSGHTLTKTGAAAMSIVDATATNSGNIVVAGGVMGITRSIVDGPGAINVLSNILFFENSSTGYVNKPITLSGGTIRVSGNDYVLAAPITNNAPGMIADVVTTLTLSNTVVGAGYLVKSNTGVLTLQAPALYSGETVVQTGTLKVGARGSMPNSSSLTLGTATTTATLDVLDVPGGFALSGGSSLFGRGSVLGDVSLSANSGLNPGASAGLLAFSNNLAMADSQSLFELGADPMQAGTDSDLVYVAGNLNLTGVNKIKIAPMATLANGVPYTLFQFGGALSGTEANLQVTSDSRYSFTPSIVGNTIQVTVQGSGASASLVWKGGAATNPNQWDTKVTTNWLNGAATDVFYLGDNVAFNDTATTPIVSVAGAVSPAAIAINNTSVAYNVTGTGDIMAGSLTKEGVGSFTAANTGGLTVAGSTTVQAGTLNLSGPGVLGPVAINGGNVNVNSGGVLLSAPVLINAGTLMLNPDADMAVPAAIGNNSGTAGTLVKQGAKQATLSGDNSGFEGTLNVNGGILRLGNNTALGSGVGQTFVNGGTLDLNGQSLYTQPEFIAISGTGLNSTGAVINAGADQQNAISNLTLSASASIGGTGRFDLRGSGGSGSFSGLLNLNSFTLTKVGPNRISIVDADVSNPGNIDIQQGLLAFTRCNVGSEGFINIRTNQLFLENYSSGEFYKPIVSSGGSVRIVGNAKTIPSTITNLGGITFDTAVNLTLSGLIQGPGSLNKLNTGGSLILTSLDNNWTGGTYINQGTLQIGSGQDSYDGSLPDAPIVNNGNLFFNTSRSFTNNFEISGTGTLSKRSGDYSLGQGLLVINASNSFSGNVNTGTGTSPQQGGIILLQNSFGFGYTDKTVNIIRTELQLAGGITIPTNIAFSTSQHTDVLGTWAGGLAAFRNIGGNNVVGGPITLIGGAGNTEFLVESGSLTINGNVAPNTTARWLVLSGSAPGYVNGSITDAGANIPSLQKRGSNTWTLSGDNTYTGTTRVTEGTLALGATGTLSGSTDVDVQANGTLDLSAVAGFAFGPAQTLRGDGKILGSVIIEGGLQPAQTAAGVEIGTLTFAGSVTLAGVTTLQIDRASVPAADLVVSGPLTLGGTLVVTNLGGAIQAGDVFNLFDAASTSGSFSSYVLPELDPGMGWDLSKLAVDGTIKAGTSVTPTPTPISFSFSANKLDMSWPAGNTGWRLESQTNPISKGLSDNWFTVPGSTFTNRVIAPVDPSAGAVFYRLVNP